MQLGLVCVLVACALSASIKERLQTSEQYSAEEWLNLLQQTLMGSDVRQGCIFTMDEDILAITPYFTMPESGVERVVGYFKDLKTAESQYLTIGRTTYTVKLAVDGLIMGESDSRLFAAKRVGDIVVLGVGNPGGDLTDPIPQVEKLAGLINP